MTKDEIKQARELIDTPITAENLEPLVPTFPRIGATQVAHWPGKDTPVCDEHLRKLVGLGAMLGFALTWTPCDETICTNCESEAKKAKP